MNYSIKPNGLMSSVTHNNLKWDMGYDDIIITTNSNRYVLSQLHVFSENTTFTYTAENAVFTVTYSPAADTSFLVRTITARFTSPAVLLEIAVTTDSCPEAFLYKTFYNASAALFCRRNHTGLCCGFENPFFDLKNGLLLFEPSLMLEAEEEFVCDLNFYGIYELYGEKIQPCLHRSQMHPNGRYQPRYRNPGEGIPLYFSEIYEFNRYTNQYFGADRKSFQFTSYNFFSNLPQRPASEEEICTYLEHIDAFAAMGGDTIILNPLHPNTVPDENIESYWELFPENTPAERILNYAKSKGLKVGMYTGTAGNGRYGNSSMISYSDNPQWKKIDIHGNISKENCIADDSFTDWFIQVQINTIEKYGLDLWNWDPGPGHGFFCFHEGHGHLPGKGSYKGFRNSLKVMKALKDRFPNLYYQGFHGNKEYGLWGFKYIDQHEAFWENEVYIMNPVYDELSVDRATSDSIRFQSIWNYYFRFMPPTLNHGLAHRMMQYCVENDLEIDNVMDFCGYKYSLLSCIAAGGSVTLPIIPRHPESVPGYLEFYHEWITFARDIFEYSKHTIPFGCQTGCGIDGFSKILDNEGYIFLFNPFPEAFTCRFRLDERLGFTCSDYHASDSSSEPGMNAEKIYPSLIYPYHKKLSKRCIGEEVEYLIPAYGCLILELRHEETSVSEDDIMPVLPRTLYSSTDTFSFFAESEIRHLLAMGKQTVTEKSIAVHKRFSKRFGRINMCWGRPDRLWLWIPAHEDLHLENKDKCNIKILVNNCEVPFEQDFLAHNELLLKNMLFADITDYVSWNCNNSIQVSGYSPDCIYLHYPKNDLEGIAEQAGTLKLDDCTAPSLDPSVQILSAALNLDNIFVPETENEISAAVNLPFEELEGVYVSVPISIGNTGNELKRDMVLEYKDGIWKKTFHCGERIHLIVDDQKLVFWAVTKDRRESPAYELPIQWIMS